MSASDPHEPIGSRRPHGDSHCEGLPATFESAWQHASALPTGCRSSVLYNSITTPALQGARPTPEQIDIPRPHARNILLAAGRLVPEKGIDQVIAIVGPALHELDAALYLAGQVYGSSHGRYASDVKSLAQKLAPPGYIHLLGRLNDLPRLMSLADVFVHTPRREAFGLVAAEALSIGVPVVSYATEGLPEILHGTPCEPVPYGRADLFMRCIRDWLRQPDKGRSALAVASHAIQRTFSGSERAKRLDELLSSAIDR